MDEFCAGCVVNYTYHSPAYQHYLRHDNVHDVFFCNVAQWTLVCRLNYMISLFDSVCGCSESTFDSLDIIILRFCRVVGRILITAT